MILAGECLDRPLVREPESDHQGDQERWIEGDEGEEAESVADPNQGLVIYGLFVEQAPSGAHEAEEAGEARQDCDRAADDQPEMRGGDLIHEQGKRDPRDQDPRYEGDLHEDVEQVVNPDRRGVQLVFGV